MQKYHKKFKYHKYEEDEENRKQWDIILRVITTVFCCLTFKIIIMAFH